MVGLTGGTGGGPVVETSRRWAVLERLPDGGEPALGLRQITSTHVLFVHLT